MEALQATVSTSHSLFRYVALPVNHRLLLCRSKCSCLHQQSQSLHLCLSWVTISRSTRSCPSLNELQRIPDDQWTTLWPCHRMNWKHFNTDSTRSQGLAHPVKSNSPVWLQSKEKIQDECPERIVICSPDATSYNATRRESPAAARSLTPGENATARTGLMRPVRMSLE